MRYNATGVGGVARRYFRPRPQHVVEVAAGEIGPLYITPSAEKADKWHLRANDGRKNGHALAMLCSCCAVSLLEGAA